jgi:hypothetical protein
MPSDQPTPACGAAIDGEPEPCALPAGHDEHLSANVIGWQRALGGPGPVPPTQPDDRGICGAQTEPGGLLRAATCELLHGHAGWHRDGGMSWTERVDDLPRVYTQADVDAAYERGKADGRREAIKVVRAQAGLPDLVHFDRPSDFRKGVLTCLAALEAREGKPDA